MTFIGVDQALRKTGVCVLREGNDADLVLIRTGKRSGPERLAYIRDAVRELLVQHTPTFAAIEGGAFNEDGRLFDLGGVHGVLQVLLWDHGIGFVNVAPAQLKKFQTTKSGAPKEWMIEAATNFLGRDVTDDNLADALGLARIARAVHREDVTTRAQASVIHKLKVTQGPFPWDTSTAPG